MPAREQDKKLEGAVVGHQASVLFLKEVLGTWVPRPSAWNLWTATHGRQFQSLSEAWEEQSQDDRVHYLLLQELIPQWDHPVRPTPWLAAHRET